MKTFILFFTLITSATALASEPTALKVFAAILKDSGVTQSYLSERQDGSFGRGETEGSKHDVVFVTGNQRFTCPIATFHSHEIAPGQFLVDASIGNCRAADGHHFTWNNDYTQNGIVVFTRVFYSNNTLFRTLTSHEQREFRQFLSGHSE